MFSEIIYNPEQTVWEWMVADGDELRTSRGILLSKRYTVLGVGGWSLKGSCGMLTLMAAEREHYNPSQVVLLHYDQGYGEQQQYRTPLKKYKSRERLG